MGLGLWPGGRQPAAAICRLEPNGTLTVVTGIVDMSGVATGFAAIAAEVFGVQPDKVNVVAADTATAPRSPMSGGSVVTYAMGRAIQKAAEAARDKLLRYASELMEIDPGDLEIVDGVVRPRGSPEQGRSVAELAESLDGFGATPEPIEGHGGAARPARAPRSRATSCTSASIPRPARRACCATSSPRTSAMRSTRRSSRASSRVARSRASAGRCSSA